MTMMRQLFLLLALMVGLAASAQDVEALYDEGKALYDKKEYKAAIQKLLPAAQQGHKKAQYRMGRCYDKGYGVLEDNDKAFSWYQKSAQQGYYKAEYQMARCYIKGKAGLFIALVPFAFQPHGIAGTPDDHKALEWVKKAIGGKKHGAEMLQEIKDEAAAGDKTDKKLLKLLGK